MPAREDAITILEFEIINIGDWIIGSLSFSINCLFSSSFLYFYNAGSAHTGSNAHCYHAIINIVSLHCR